MDQNTELKYLRARRETEIAIATLEAEAAQVAKRYKRGVKAMSIHIANIDAEIDDGTDAIPGMSVLDTANDALAQLIADPTLDNVKEEDAV